MSGVGGGYAFIGKEAGFLFFNTGGTEQSSAINPRYESEGTATR